MPQNGIPTSRELALLALGSGDEVLGNIGALLGREAAADTRYERQLSRDEQEHRRAIELANMRLAGKAPSHLGQGWFRDPRTGEITQDPSMAQWHREQALLESRQRVAEAGEKADIPTARMGSEATLFERQGAAARELAGDVLKLGENNPGFGKGVRSTARDLGESVLDIVLPDKMARTTTQKLRESTMSPAELEYTARAERRAAAIRKEIAGTGLSENEAFLEALSAATAPGISAEEAARRWNVIADIMDENAIALRNPGGVPAPTPSAPQYERITDPATGKVYEVRDGQFYEVQ
jgi:hypothetical protein